ncbi:MULTISPECIES: hypothetical protein [unclassified Afipia]|uniref:hypothetical protein n=1 Tax=unclassified Afipia TaxID=2642050 RepID=UPI0012692020|nr:MULTISPECIES: hypothetical protein [unclassified Afipia]
MSETTEKRSTVALRQKLFRWLIEKDLRGSVEKTLPVLESPFTVATDKIGLMLAAFLVNLFEAICRVSLCNLGREFIRNRELSTGALKRIVSHIDQFFKNRLLNIKKQIDRSCVHADKLIGNPAGPVSVRGLFDILCVRHGMPPPFGNLKVPVCVRDPLIHLKHGLMLSGTF